MVCIGDDEGEVGEDAAETNLAEQGFEVAGESFERGSDLQHSARRRNFFNEAFVLFPILIHQEAHAAVAKTLEVREQERDRKLIAFLVGAARELDEIPEVAIENERFFAARVKVVEEFFAVERGVEDLRERDG